MQLKDTIAFAFRDFTTTVTSTEASCATRKEVKAHMPKGDDVEMGKHENFPVMPIYFFDAPKRFVQALLVLRFSFR